MTARIRSSTAIYFFLLLEDDEDLRANDAARLKRPADLGNARANVR